MALTSRTRVAIAAVPALVVIALLFSAGCTSTPAKQTGVSVSGERQNLTIATATSLYDTGLFDMIQEKYENSHNVRLIIIPEKTTMAIERAKRGDADILLISSPNKEILILEGGNGMNRRSFAYNYLEIVGPKNDPAGILNLSPANAFKKIRTLGINNTPGIVFISRGDSSDTHSAEKWFWSKAGYNYARDIQKSGNWYVEAGTGMRETLQMASDKSAYTISNEATYFTYRENLNLTPLGTMTLGDVHVFSVMTVYPQNPDAKKIAAANDFVNFLIAPDTQTDIGNYGRDKYGKSLFTPMSAGVPKGVTADFTTPATATRPMVIFYAGSLLTPFTKLQKMYMTAHPDVDVIGIPGSSGGLVDHVTKQNMKPSVIAVSDSALIQKNMIPGNASWFANFAKNSIVLCYTNKSRYANEINTYNWYSILARPDVTFAISDPNIDPSGYRSLMTIKLAERADNTTEIFSSLIPPSSNIAVSAANGITTIDVTHVSPVSGKLVIANTRSDLIPLLKSGAVDYTFEYWSIAVQNNLSYIDLFNKYDFSLASQNDVYKTVQVKRTSGTEIGSQIVYGITVPTAASQPGDGIAFVQLVLGKQGQEILTSYGQTPIAPAEVYGNVPVELSSLVVKK